MTDQENKQHINGVFRLRRAIGALAASALLLQGCQGLGLVEQVPPEELVTQRAQARWDALIAGEWEKAYAFNTPAYRESVDLFTFRSRNGAPPAKLKGAKAVGAKCDESSCDVTMQVSFEPLQPGFPELTTEHSERWVQSEGKWWRFEKF